ncbi:MAG: neutral/alkaline non-lysosomal ceramidase N-terminal domain-containing protein [Chryseotalea sp.]
MNIIKKIAKAGLWFIVTLTVLFFIFFAPINDKPLEKQSFYHKNIQAVNKVKLDVYPTQQTLKVAWRKINITPHEFIAMAGYRPRNAFETVHDSLFAKVMVMDNGSAKFAMISLDLLLFPPALKEKLNSYKDELHITDYYLSATHTHNGFGCWNNSFAGEIIAGTYSEALLDSLTEKIIRSIKIAQQDVQPAKLSYTEIQADELVINRLEDNAPVDGTVRALQFVRADSSKALWLTFSGHPTSISKKSLALSADYPAVIAREMVNDGVEFTMFMAGMVGSHRVRDNGLSDFDLVEKTGQAIAEKIHRATWVIQPDTLPVVYSKVPLQFGYPQVRITSHMKVRSWLFNAALNPLQGEIQLLSVGNINFISTPCDFSGELFIKNIKNTINQPVVITSFNGDYVGYITEDKYYFTSKKEEVRAMNWVGPYHGEMFATIINTLLKKKESLP